jgi:Ribbon-helix-helix protein, copG family
MSDQDTKKRGKPRLYPPCTRYRSHTFSPKTNRCPCGFQRPGTVKATKINPLVAYTFRLPSETLQDVERLATEQGKGISEIIREAVNDYIKARLPF